MTNDNHQLGELYDLAAAQCEGELTAQQAARLEQLVLDDARLRSRYLLYMQVHALAEREAAPDASGEQQVPEAHPASVRASAQTGHARGHTFRIWLAATASALALVALVSWGIWPWIFPPTSAATVQKESETVPVVVTATEIRRGQRILPGDLNIQRWPARYAPEGAITRLEDATGTDQRPHWASSNLVPGELLSKAKVARIRDLQVRPGYRAYTIQCSTVRSNVAGLVRAGDFVDVLCARRDPQQTSADILVEGVKVLAVDQPSSPGRNTENLPSVTLETTLEEAAVLAQGQSQGPLTLALRSPPEPGDGEPAAAMVPESPRVLRIRTCRGGQPGTVIVIAPTSDTEHPDAPPSAEAPSPEASSREVRIRTYRGRSLGQVQISVEIP